MGTVDDLKQKTKGEIEEVKGEINQQRGKGVKGGMQKMKGKFDKTAADTKMRARQEDKDDVMEDDDL